MTRTKLASQLTLGLVAITVLIALSSAADAQTVGVVNINTATEAELQRLPGVGSALANAIYTYAEAGPGSYDWSRREPSNPECDHKCHFKSVEDLLEVKGIGRKKLEQIAPYVTLTGATTLKVKVRSVAAVDAAPARPPGRQYQHCRHAAARLPCQASGRRWPRGSWCTAHSMGRSRRRVS